MESIPYSTIQKGTFLIATPDIDSGLFFRSVVLVCEHNPTGSFGLIINRSLDVELPEEIISLNRLTNPRVGIRAGGPVQTNQMMLVHTAGDQALSTDEPEGRHARGGDRDHERDRDPHGEERHQEMLSLCDGVWLGGDLQFLQESVADVNGPNVILCFGYSGWGAGQLEREFLDGNWFLHPASEEYIFHTPADKLWHTLLRDMGGRYASLSLIPEDLSMN